MLALVAALCIVSAPHAAAPAASCAATPTDGAGPFGRGLPPRRAKFGTGHVLTGVVLSTTCRPLAGAIVEVWQSNKQGAYTRAGSATVLTNAAGRFRVEGPRPVGYEGRPGHIHLRVTARGYEQLVTRYEPAPGARRGSMRIVLAPEAL